jgi:hypothetical protein
LLSIPDREHKGLIKFDARDPEAVFKVERFELIASNLTKEQEEELFENLSAE